MSTKLIVIEYCVATQTDDRALRNRQNGMFLNRWQSSGRKSVPLEESPVMSPTADFDGPQSPWAQKMTVATGPGSFVVDRCTEIFEYHSFLRLSLAEMTGFHRYRSNAKGKGAHPFIQISFLKPG
jgi:hypothetical protein